jgi:hypothetical protein
MSIDDSLKILFLESHRLILIIFLLLNTIKYQLKEVPDYAGYRMLIDDFRQKFLF